MFGIGLPELLIILLVALLIFGAARLPEIGKALGRAIGEFKKASSEFSSKDEKKDNSKD
jgi:TatA/E family protein of Tat protein translocase